MATNTLWMLGIITVVAAAILAFFLRSNTQSYGRAFFWSLLMLIGLMALLVKVFSTSA